MMWFFERPDERVRVVTRFDTGNRQYVLDIFWSGRPIETLRFRDRASFQACLSAIEAQLAADSWVPAAAEVLPHGPHASST